MFSDPKLILRDKNINVFLKNICKGLKTAHIKYKSDITTVCKRVY